jgi:hypothetical protein
MSSLQKGNKLECTVCRRISLFKKSYKILNNIFTRTFFTDFGSTIVGIEKDEQQKVTCWHWNW